ncbi:hypothetical protein F0562_016400 [Nyssa sinensis]|uniref:Uncharacterized protein n=1 Tax=Nyssa sinensis TaxID=561372 RepID=A0A5J4ZMC5_9ASTE|nr:hypothetical protein F0562_016400 [Nyssa sinensis]
MEKVSRESSPEKNVHVTEPTQSGEDDGESKGNDISAIPKIDTGSSPPVRGRRCAESNGSLSISESHFTEVETVQIRNLSEKSQESDKKHILYDFNDEQEDGDYVLATAEEKDCNMDDETTLLEEEELANAESNDPIDEIALLQKESEIPIGRIACKDSNTDEEVEDDSESEYASASEDIMDSPPAARH